MTDGPPVSSLVESDGDSVVVPDDLECVRCGYNLRGLEQPRCPECGLEFSWEEALNPDLRPHPYLYEHHDGRQRVRRLAKTVVSAWVPWRFWRTMRLTHARYPGRLAVFVLFLLFIGSMVSILVPPALATGAAYYAFSTPKYGSSVPPGLEFDAARKRGLRRLRRSSEVSAISSAVYTSMTVLTVAAMSIFLRSLRRHRILSGHLWRVVVYSAAPNAILFFSWQTVALGIGSVFGLSGLASGIETPLIVVITVWLIGIIAHWFVSLFVAGYIYLQVKGWWLIVLSCQVIAFLATLAVVVYGGLLIGLAL